jgi:ribonuclease BN (tRNA processing enzyme)
MAPVEFTFLGCGDAFGSGGRFNTCFHVKAPSATFLIDCGASSMISIRKHDVDPNAVDAILITHLHGDHFGGLPFFILDAQLGSRRTQKLTIAGPPGLRDRLYLAMEVFFPGSSGVAQKFELDVVEFTPNERSTLGPLTVKPHLVRHPCGAPPLALRVEVDGKSLCYTGDTEWVDAILDAAKGVDLFVCEVYFEDKPVRFHLNWQTVRQHLPAIGAKRVVVTHMSPEMLARVAALGVEAAYDGLKVAI